MKGFELQEHYLMCIFKRSLCLVCDSREANMESGRKDGGG